MRSKSKSYWISSTPRTGYPGLSEDVSFDVAVIGAGMTGLTAAILLKREGKKVAVIEQHRVGRGSSGHTTAHLTELVDTTYKQLLRDFGKQGARLVAQSSRAAIERIRSLAEELDIECDYKRVPAFLYAEKPEQVQKAKDEVEAARTAGLEARWTDEVPLPFKTHGALLLKNQAQFHPQKYMLGLAAAIDGDGCAIFENTHVLSVSDGEPYRLTTESGKTVTAPEVVIATNAPITSTYIMPARIPAYRSYAIGVKFKAAGPPAGLYWDLDSPYHYTRSHDGIWIIGGEDHKTGMNEDTWESYERLAKYARLHFNVDSIQYHWSGQILEPVDGLPYIGRDPLSRHVYIATGFTGNGMTFGTLSGMLIADLILRRSNPWAALYNPRRLKPKASLTSFISENKDFPVCLVKDRLKTRKASADSIARIPRDGGAVVRLGGKPVAVHKDRSGEVHCVSAVCTHMGCYVHWNSAERSWDCPCHGSRFGTNGAVLDGPATKALHEVELPETQQTPKPKVA